MNPIKHNVLVVDDDITNLEATQVVLEHWGYHVITACGGDEALAALRNSSDEIAVVLLDYRMPGKDGAVVAQEIRALNQECVIAMYSCDSTRDAPIRSQRAGAIDFIDKDDVSYLRATMERLCAKYQEGRTLKIEDRPIGQSEAEKLIASVGMVGRSEEMAAVARKILRYRSGSRTVLITGESGTGKELVARALHEGPKDKFIAVNCAAFAKGHQLLESELFGHEKGSFTGAVSRKIGLMEAARDGTLFLDEIHHLSLESQAQLLRAIQEKRIRRVGSNVEYPVNFRIVVATKPDIEQRVEAGDFLPDLYYRIRQLQIDVPTLKDRPQDIEPLVTHFCKKHLKETGEKKTFLYRAVKMLEDYNWPGNIRDLENTVLKALAECSSASVDTHHLDQRIFVNRSHSVEVSGSFADLEAKHVREKNSLILQTLRNSKSAARAAQRLGLPPTTLRSMLTRLDGHEGRQLEQAAKTVQRRRPNA